MKLALLILNNVNLLDQLLEELLKVGIRGGTIIDSQGMARRISEHDHDESEYLVRFLKNLLVSPRPFNKTLIFAIKEDQINPLKETVDKVTGGLENPNTGVLLILDLHSVYGIRE